MKKLTKIFATLLTFCLIFGVTFSVVASAAGGESDNPLDVTGYVNNFSYDYENDDIGTWANGAVDKGRNIGVASMPDSNKYLNLSPNLDYTTPNNSSTQFKKITDISNATFVTVDYDFATDRYYYVKPDGTHTTYDEDGAPITDVSQIPEGCEYYPAYGPAGNTTQLKYFGLGSIQFTAPSAINSGHIRLQYDNSNGKFYVTHNSYSSTAPRAYLSNEVGVFDHVTMLMVIKSDDSGYVVDRYLYLNGAYFGMQSQTFDSSSLSINAYLFYVPPMYWNATAFVGDTWSWAIDNFAVNVYKSDYTYSEENGLDKYDYTQPIYNCPDILYNDTYVSPGSPLHATINHADGSKKDCYNMASIRKGIMNGDVVDLYVPFEDYKPASQDIKCVTFALKEGGEFTYDPSIEEYYLVQNTDNRYTVKLASDDAMKIKWYDSEGENRKLLKEQVLLPLFVPDASVDALQMFGKVNDGKIGIFKGWKLDTNNDGVADIDFTFSEMTVAQIDELYDSGITEINMLPIFEETDIAYLIETMSSKGGEKPDLYAPDYNYAKFTDIATISSAISGLSESAEVKVTLYKDLELSDTTLAIPAGVTVSFDLHGHGIQAKASAFTLADGVELNLYSTVQGGAVYQTDEASAVGLISASEFDSCTVNIGKALNSDGSVLASGFNLSLFAKSVASFDAAANSTKALNAVVNLNGGSYYGVYKSGDMFWASNANLKLNISEALVASGLGGSVFAASNAASADIKITDNSVIFSGIFGATAYQPASIIGDWSKTSKLYISDSKVVGEELNKANVTLGKYNMLSLAMDDKYVNTEAGVGYARANNGVSTETLYFAEMNVPVEYFVLSYETGAELKGDFKKIVPVTWLNLENQTYATNYWCIGSNVDYIEANFGIKELNNGWYNGVYDSWKNATVGVAADSKLIVADRNNVFAPTTKGVVTDLDIKLNFEVSDSFYYNIYLPKLPVVDGVNITFDGFFDADENSIPYYENVTLEEVGGFYQLRGQLAAKDFKSGYITIKYTVGSVTLTEKINVSFLEYAYKVDNSFGACSDESKLVYAMMQYKLEAYKQTLGENAEEGVVASVDTYLKSHGAACTCSTVEYDEPTETLDYAAFDNVLKGISYGLLVTDDFTSKYTMSIFADSSVTAVFAKITSALGEKTLVFERIVHTDYVEYRCSDIPLELLSRVMEITVTTDTQLVGTFSLAEYIKYSEDTGVAKALYVISKAAYAKKIAE